MAIMTAAEQKGSILSVFVDFADNDDIDGLFDFLDHCGIDVRKMRDCPSSEFSGQLMV